MEALCGKVKLTSICEQVQEGRKMYVAGRSA
nr:MAG TPA: hypothetical protein [Caudoviricetes sp.]